MRYFWATALAISATLSANAARAHPASTFITIPSGTLANALTALAAQTGLSFGFDGPIPLIAVRGFGGRMSAHAALRKLLHGMPIRAVRIGPASYRLTAGTGLANDMTEAASREAAPLPDIIITARKLPELISRVPSPISVYLPSKDEGGRATRGSRDLARTTDNVVVAGRGAGSDKIFIRGLADSPFNGFSQTAVSVQVDDGRVTYDAAEPGLRLADVARVEVLKGPQGPLYGTGALGGVYRVVTNRPVLDGVSGEAALSAQTIAKGGPGASGEAMVNLPLVTDKLGLRVVGYSGVEGGWIDDRPGRTDANDMLISGGRASMRALVADAWTVDFTGATQDIHARDSRYVYRKGKDLTRPVSMLEPHDSSFDMLQARVAGPIGDIQLVIATSQTWQRQSDLYSLLEAPDPLNIPGAISYRDHRSYKVFDQEVRLASGPGATFSWTTGLSYLSATTRAQGDVLLSDGQHGDVFLLHRDVTEAAFFADGSWPIAPQLALAAGFRIFRSSGEDKREESTSPAFSARKLIGFTPNLSLSYDLGVHGIIYARFATAFRPGGIDPGNTRTGRYEADEVRNLDLGARLSFDDGRLVIDIGTYATRWHDMQSDYLDTDGLLATRNVGTAGVIGAELSLEWRLDRHWRLDGGFTLQRARLTDPLDSSDLTSDRRLPLTPDFAFHATIARDLRIGGTPLRAYGGINFTGSRRLSFDEGLDRPMEAFATTRAGISATLSSVRLSFDIDNVFDSRADTFAYGNPFSVRTLSQFTPLRPRTMSVSISRSF